MQIYARRRLSPKYMCTVFILGPSGELSPVIVTFLTVLSQIRSTRPTKDNIYKYQTVKIMRLAIVLDLDAIHKTFRLHVTWT